MSGHLTEGQRFTLASRLHSEAIFVYNWICGPYRHRGMGSDGVQNRSARRTAERVQLGRGWTPEQLCQWFSRPEDLPRAMPRGTGGARMGGSGGGWEAVDATLQRLAPQSSPPPSASLEFASNAARKILRQMRGSDFAGAIPAEPQPVGVVEEDDVGDLFG